MEACCSRGADQLGADSTSYCNRIVISFLTAGKPNNEVGANSVRWFKDVPISQHQNRTYLHPQQFAESAYKGTSVYQDTEISVYDKAVENAPSISTEIDPKFANEKSKNFLTFVSTLKENRNDDVLPSADGHKFVLLLNSDRKAALSSHLVKKRQINLLKDRGCRTIQARMPAFRKTGSNKNGKLYEKKRRLTLDLLANRLSCREIKKFINEYKTVLQDDATLKSTNSLNEVNHPQACVNSVNKHSEKSLQNLFLDRLDPNGKSTIWRLLLNNRIKRNSENEKGESANDGIVALKTGNSFVSPLTSGNDNLTYKRMPFKRTRKNKGNNSPQLLDSKINLSTKITSRSSLMNDDLIEAANYFGTTSTLNFRHALGNSQNTTIINEMAEIIQPDYSLNTNSRSSTISRINDVIIQNIHLGNDSWRTVRTQAMKFQNVSYATTLERKLKVKFTRNTVIPKIKSKKKLWNSTRINEEADSWSTVVDSADDESNVTPEIERMTSSWNTIIPETTEGENGLWYGEILNKPRENVPLTNSIPKIVYEKNMSWKTEGMNVSWSAASPGLESEKFSGRASNPKRITKKHNMSYTAIIPMRIGAENISTIDFKSKIENISWSAVITNKSDSQPLSFLIRKTHHTEYNSLSALGAVDKEKTHDPWSTIIPNKTYRKQTPSSAPIRQIQNSRNFKQIYKGNFVWNTVIPKKRLGENVSRSTVIPEIIDRENVSRNAIKVEPIFRAHFLWNTLTPKRITRGNISWSTFIPRRIAGGNVSRNTMNFKPIYRENVLSNTATPNRITSGYDLRSTMNKNTIHKENVGRNTLSSKRTAGDTVSRSTITLKRITWRKINSKQVFRGNYSRITFIPENITEENISQITPKNTADQNISRIATASETITGEMVLRSRITPKKTTRQCVSRSKKNPKRITGAVLWNTVIPKVSSKENISRSTVVPDIETKKMFSSEAVPKIIDGLSVIQGTFFTRDGYEGNSLSSSVVPKKERAKMSWNKEIPRRIVGDNENVIWNSGSLKTIDHEDKVTLKVVIPEREIRQDVSESTVSPRRLKAEDFSWNTFIPKIINGDFNPRINSIPNKVDSGYVSRSSIVPTRKDRAVTNSITSPRGKYDKNIVSDIDISKSVSTQRSSNNSDVEILPISSTAENASRSSVIPDREPISWSIAIPKRINEQNEINGIVNNTNDISRKNSLWSTIVPKIVERVNVSWSKQSSNFLIDGNVSKDGIARNSSWWSTIVPKITEVQNILSEAIPNRIIEKTVIHDIANTKEIDGDYTSWSTIMPNISETGNVSWSKEISRRIDGENNVRVTGIPDESNRDILWSDTNLGITDRDDITLNIEIPERKITNQSISSNTVNPKRTNLGDFSWNTFIPKIINGDNISWITLIRDIIDIGNISSSPVIPTRKDRDVANTDAIPKRRNGDHLTSGTKIPRKENRQHASSYSDVKTLPSNSVEKSNLLVDNAGAVKINGKTTSSSNNQKKKQTIDNLGTVSKINRISAGKSRINENKLHPYTTVVSRKVNKKIFTVSESTKSDLSKFSIISQHIRPVVKSTTEKQGKLSNLKMPSTPKRVDRQNSMKPTPLVLRGNHSQVDSFRIEPNVDLVGKLGNFTYKGKQFTSSDRNLNTNSSYSNRKTKPTSDSSTDINRKKNSNSISHKSSTNWMKTSVYSSTVSSHDRTENETRTSSYSPENSSEQNAMRPVEKVNALSEDNYVYSYDKNGFVREETSSRVPARNSLKESWLENRGEYRKIAGDFQPFQFTGRGITFITYVPPFPFKQQSAVSVMRTPSREAAMRISSHWRKQTAITKYVYTSNVKYQASPYDPQGEGKLGEDYILLYSPSWRKNKVDYSNQSKIYVTLKVMLNNETDLNYDQDENRWRKSSQLYHDYEDATQPYLFYINIYENSSESTTENSEFLAKRIFKKKRSKVNTANIKKGIGEKDLYFKSRKDRLGFNVNLMIIVVIRIVQEMS